MEDLLRILLVAIVVWKFIELVISIVSERTWLDVYDEMNGKP
jgi:hypothetical protein